MNCPAKIVSHPHVNSIWLHLRPKAASKNRLGGALTACRGHGDVHAGSSNLSSSDAFKRPMSFLFFICAQFSSAFESFLAELEQRQLRHENVFLF